MSRYNVGDKFIIEIGEVFTGDVSEQNGAKELFRIKGFRSLVFDNTGLGNLERFDGSEYRQGVIAGLDSHNNDVCNAYNMGLNDAWELAKKIEEKLQADREKIFNLGYSTEIFQRLTPQEALTKLEAYEKEQVEIKVGDVVRFKKNPSCEILITATSRGLNGVHLQTGEFGRKGEVHSDICKDYIEKTGKHIDISAILAEIGKE